MTKGVLLRDSDLQESEKQTEENQSTVTQDFGDGERLNKEIRVDHILQWQEADDSGDMQAIN